MAQLLVFGFLAGLQPICLSVDGVEDSLCHLLLPPLRDGEGEVAVELLVAVQQLHHGDRAGTSITTGLPSPRDPGRVIWSTPRDIGEEEPGAQGWRKGLLGAEEGWGSPRAGLRAQVQGPARPSTLIPFVSSSSKEPMSKASAAFTSPRGGISGGGYCGRTGAGHQHGAETAQHSASPGPHSYLLQEDHLPV